MLQVREAVGINSFIAIVNHLPDGGLMLASEKHMYNFKYIEKLKAFVRMDEESPRPQVLGYPNRDWLATVKDMKVYAQYHADTTHYWKQLNRCGLSAANFYGIIKQPINDKFQIFEPKTKKSKRWTRTWSQLILHP